jgi:hypothetical protein
MNKMLLFSVLKYVKEEREKVDIYVLYLNE